MAVDCTHDIDIDYRIQPGWKKFFANKSDLCGKHCTMENRIGTVSCNSHAVRTLLKQLVDDDGFAGKVTQKNSAAC